MYKEKVLAVAAAIRKSTSSGCILPMEFNMATLGEQQCCGTVGCIAGFAAALFRPEEYQEYVTTPQRITLDPSYLARESLGLTPWEADMLFFPNMSCQVDLYKVTPEIAVSVLEHFAETGQIKWPVSAKRPVKLSGRKMLAVTATIRRTEDDASAPASANARGLKMHPVDRM